MTRRLFTPVFPLLVLGLLVCGRATGEQPAKEEISTVAVNDSKQDSRKEKAVSIHFLEIVTPEVNATCDLLEKTQGVKFSMPDSMLGYSRTAVLAGGGRIGVRAPLRDTEEPVVRPYLLVDDIEAAIAAAEAAGGEFAMYATEIPGHGRFAIYFLGGIQHGLWQR